MDQNRIPMSQMERKGTLSRYRSKFKFGETVFSLVSNDLLFGLTKEEVERYLKKDLDITQMRVISKCLRSGYDQEAIGVIAKDGFSGQQMEVALEFYEKGVAIEHIEEVMEKEKAPYVMRAAYQEVMEKVAQVQPETAEGPEYVSALLEQIKSVVSKIEFQEKRYDALNEKLTIFESTKKEEEIRDGLVKTLEEKDQLINSQQDLLNQANATVARLRNDLEGKENIFDLKENTTKEELVPKQAASHAPLPFVYGISTLYPAAFVDGNGKVVQTPPIEVEEKKTSGMVGLFSKIGMKKKSRRDIVKLVAEKELCTEQLVQIRSAIEKGLTEKQLVRLIHSKGPAGHMKEIIEIAVLENSLED